MGVFDKAFTELSCSNQRLTSTKKASIELAFLLPTKAYFLASATRLRANSSAITLVGRPSALDASKTSVKVP